jgi:hypothetical protein
MVKLEKPITKTEYNILTIAKYSGLLLVCLVIILGLYMLIQNIRFVSFLISLLIVCVLVYIITLQIRYESHGVRK